MKLRLSRPALSVAPASRARALTGALAAVSALCACGAPRPVGPQDNQVFYHEDGLGEGADIAEKFERPFPPLDLTGAHAYEGVGVLEGAVRLSRPADWTIRAASVDPEARYIEYISPRQFIFSIYERLESPRDSWYQLMHRYQEETVEQGGVFLGPGAPSAVWNAQARAYDVLRQVPAPKAPFRNHSREYLVRGLHRVVLVQIVRPEESLEPVSDELLRVMQTLQVL